ncbi:hypothetical protein CGZ94_06355 [Enemella evansiae]|uniref:Uncharacterized protein n=1 Tax=Enemella evansiae TaxID=2016499 RepID=A0A255GEH1_9ACTN|nr:hypothetical protein [Enemella evansiae]OYO14249.1 hypothetical protein CGZ94_06355 [Enemella evansiae]
MTHGRITFADSPWPGGHALDRIELTVRGDDEGALRLHLHAETQDYDAENPGVQPVAGDGATPWQQPEVWQRYTSAILSSTKWGNAGVKLPVAADKFRETMLDQLELTADPTSKVSLDEAAEELAFGCYVLGQDLSGDHRIRFTRVGSYTYDLTWTGQIAATFIGEQDFSAGHRFELVAEGVRLS